MDKEISYRAIMYARALVALQEVGMGEDRNLWSVRETASAIRYLCKDETGYNLGTYPTKEAKMKLSNEKEAGE